MDRLNGNLRNLLNVELLLAVFRDLQDFPELRFRLEKIIDVFVVDLEIGTLDVEVLAAVVLQFVDYFLEGMNQHSVIFVYLVPVWAEHGVGLATAGLSIQENSATHSIKRGLHD